MTTVLCSVLFYRLLMLNSGKLEFLWVLNLKVSSIVVLAFSSISPITSLGSRLLGTG